MISYGMSKFKLADTAQISVDEADRIIKNFLSVVPALESFLNRLSKFAVKNGYIITNPVFGRIRWFPKYKSSNFKDLGEIERAAKNSVPQGTNADIIKLALCNLQEIIDKNNYPVKIVLTIHDEILTECEESFAEKWKLILETTMIAAAKNVIKTVPVLVEGVISDYWTK